MLNVMVILLTLSGGLERGPSIGVRGVFLQEGGISQPIMLLACFNSYGLPGSTSCEVDPAGALGNPG